MNKQEFKDNLTSLIDSYINQKECTIDRTLLNKSDKSIEELFKTNYTQSNISFITCKDIKDKLKVYNIGNKKIGRIINLIYKDIKRKQIPAIIDNNITTIIAYGLKPIKEDIKEDVKEDVKGDVKEDIKDSGSLIYQFDSKK